MGRSSCLTPTKKRRNSNSNIIGDGSNGDSCAKQSDGDDYCDYIHYKQSGMTRSDYVMARKLKKTLLNGFGLMVAVTAGGSDFYNIKPATKTVSKEFGLYP